jgi:hypothetical protein
MYGPPQVVNFRVMAAAGPGSTAAASEVQQANGAPIGYWVITYDRPMDPKFNQAKAWYITEPNGVACTKFKPKECDGDTGPGGFQWTEGNTQERHPIYCGQDPIVINLELNAEECGRKTFYRETMGNIMEPFFGCADSFDILNNCPE